MDHRAARRHQDQQARGPEPLAQTARPNPAPGKAALDKEARAFGERSGDIGDLPPLSIEEEHLVGVGVEAVCAQDGEAVFPGNLFGEKRIDGGIAQPVGQGGWIGDYRGVRQIPASLGSCDQLGGAQTRTVHDGLKQDLVGRCSEPFARSGGDMHGVLRDLPHEALLVCPFLGRVPQAVVKILLRRQLPRPSPEGQHLCRYPGRPLSWRLKRLFRFLGTGRYPGCLPAGRYEAGLMFVEWLIVGSLVVVVSHPITSQCEWTPFAASLALTSVHALVSSGQSRSLKLSAEGPRQLQEG